MTKITKKKNSMDILRSEVNDDPGLLFFCQTGTIHHFSKGKLLVSAGDKSDKIFLLLKGSVQIFCKDGNGKEMIISLLSGLNFFGEMGYLEQEKIRHASVLSRTDVKIVEMTYEKFKECIKAYPSLLHSLAVQLARRLIITSIQLSSLVFNDGATRVLEVIKKLASLPEAMSHPLGTQIKVTRQEIGLMIGCSRETVGRILKELEEKKIITAHGKTLILFNDKISDKSTLW